MSYDNPSIAELKQRYPDLEIFWSHWDIPDNYHSKSTLKKNKKWNESLKPVAVKGNSRIKGGHYFLYKEP